MKHGSWSFCLLTGSAYAHPGEHHQDWLQSVVHLLTEPDHLAMIALAIAGGIWFARRSIKNKQDKHHEQSH